MYINLKKPFLHTGRLFSSDVGIIHCESDSDNNLRSMNSTLESFSENAWDNYQVNLFQLNKFAYLMACK